MAQYATWWYDGFDRYFVASSYSFGGITGPDAVVLMGRAHAGSGLIFLRSRFDSGVAAACNNLRRRVLSVISVYLSVRVLLRGCLDVGDDAIILPFDEVRHTLSILHQFIIDAFNSLNEKKSC